MDISILGPEMIQTVFDEAKGKPFKFLTPDNQYVFVSDPRQTKKLDNAPGTMLSLQAASKQVSRFKMLDSALLTRRPDAATCLYHVSLIFIICSILKTTTQRCVTRKIVMCYGIPLEPKIRIDTY